MLMQSLKQCQLAINYIENCGCELKYQSRQPDEPAHYCYDCDCEVFNILFVSEQPETTSATKKASASSSSSSSQQSQQLQHVVHCQACARKRNHLLDNFVILNQYTMEDLKSVYDQFQLCVPTLQHILNDLNSTETSVNTTVAAATAAVAINTTASAAAAIIDENPLFSHT